MFLKDCSEEEFKKIVKESLCVNDIIRKLGYSTTSGRNHWTIQKRIKELNIDTSHFTSIKGKNRTNEELFVENSDARNNVVRRRVKKYNLIEYKCSICGLEKEWNGKSITLILDHKNGNNTDNRLENLRWVCPNCNSQLETTGFHGIIKYDSCGNKIKEKPINKKTINKKPPIKICSTCGKPISNNAKKCLKCANRDRRVPIDNMRVSREELKKLIRTKSFYRLGKDYNVSDNTIRKWCVKLDLPIKARAISSMTDEEWEKI